MIPQSDCAVATQDPPFAAQMDFVPYLLDYVQ